MAMKYNLLLSTDPCNKSPFTQRMEELRDNIEEGPAKMPRFALTKTAKMAADDPPFSPAEIPLELRIAESIKLETEEFQVIKALSGTPLPAVVYAAMRAPRPEFDTQVALKFCHRDHPAHKGARRALKLRHQTVVKVEAIERVAIDDSLIAIQMQYLGDFNLARLFQHGDPLPIPPPNICFDLLCAVQALHYSRLVHNGIFLSNVMLVPGKGAVLIGYTYLSKATPDGVCSTRLGRDLRHPDAVAFIAPELRGVIDPRGTYATDIFALGVCFHEIARRTGFSDLFRLVPVMVKEDPRERATIDDLIFHPLFKDFYRTECADEDNEIARMTAMESLALYQSGFLV
jgi:serine/threonine protein kinase